MPAIRRRFGGIPLFVGDLIQSLMEGVPRWCLAPTDSQSSASWRRSAPLSDINSPANCSLIAPFRGRLYAPEASLG